MLSLINNNRDNLSIMFEEGAEIVEEAPEVVDGASGFIRELAVERNVEHVDEIKKLVDTCDSQGNTTLLNENLFDLLCCFTTLSQAEVSDNATTKKRDLFQQLAINFRNVYDNIF